MAETDRRVGWGVGSGDRRRRRTPTRGQRVGPGKGRVKRNTEALIETLRPDVGRDADGSLALIDVSTEQALDDLARLEELIRTRRAGDVDALAEMHLGYVAAAPPEHGQKAGMAYRLRMLFLDRRSLWPRLTRYRAWQGPKGETIGARITVQNGQSVDGSRSGIAPYVGTNALNWQ